MIVSPVRATFGGGPRLLRSLALCGAVLAAAVQPACAHRAATGRAEPEGAIIIPNLTHGQMRVIADHQAAILRLADRQDATDSTMRRLQAFATLQRFVCAWGLVPGSITDEDSPFNECAHAYLAATRALLVHLRTMPGDRTETAALVRTIELEMLSNGASLLLCRFSDEPFTTAEYVTPHLGPVPLDPLSVGKMVLGAALLLWPASVMAHRKRASLPAL